MISEFSVCPKPQNNKAKIIFLLTLLCAVVVFFVSTYMKRYSGVVGLCALLLFVTAILFYTKYISVSFRYDIMISDDIPLFVVRQIVGKRESTLCRIELADIYSVERETASERRAHKTPSGYLKYVYTPTFSPSEIYRLTVKGRYEKCEIIIEGAEKLASLLNSYAIEARELRAQALDIEE